MTAPTSAAAGAPAGTPPPGPGEAPGRASRVLGPTFRSLTVRNYRVWAAGALVSNVGTWMQRVAQDWLVLTVLTADSAVAVGITTALQFGPQLLLGPVTGAVADRFPQRAVLAVTQAAMGLWALVLGLLVVLGDPQLWQVYALAGLLGVTSAFDSPVRQTFVTSLVPPAMLANAVGLNSASFHGARLVGPAVAGLLIAAVGTGWVFLINAATFAATFASLALMRSSEMQPAPRRRRGRGATREGLAYVRGRPDIVLILLVVGVVGAFGLNFQLTTALMARVEFGLGADSYGLLGSIMAIGSLTGALLAARREHPRLRLVVGAAAAFGVFSILAATMPGYWTFAAALVPVGLASLTLMTAANATVQMTTAPELRGRVMALYMAVFAGTTPIGAPLIGWIGETWGPRWSIASGGIAALLVVAVVLVVVGRRREVRVSYRLHARPHLLVEVGELGDPHGRGIIDPVQVEESPVPVAAPATAKATAKATATATAAVAGARRVA